MDLLESGDATVLRHNVGALGTGTGEGALEGEDDAAGGCCADGLRGVEQCCGRRAEQG